MPDQDPKPVLRDFLSRMVKGHELRDDDDIFATGMVNSLFAMELITFVESTFNIAVETEDLELANFSTVDALTALVERKTAGV